MDGPRDCARIGLPLLFVAALGLGSLMLSTAAAEKKPPRPQTPVRDPEHVFRRHVKSWREIKLQNVVMQRRDYSCGAAALATLLRYHWEDPVTEDDVLRAVLKILTIEELKERIQNGLSLTDLRRTAVQMGYLSTIGRLEFEKLKESKIPLIVGIVVEDFDHFVVFRGTDGVWVYLADPARGNVRVPVDEFTSQWQQNAVLVVVKPNVDPTRISPLSLDPLEVMVGETNRLWVRDQLSGPVGGLPSQPTP